MGDHPAVWVLTRTALYRISKVPNRVVKSSAAVSPIQIQRARKYTEALFFQSRSSKSGPEGRTLGTMYQRPPRPCAGRFATLHRLPVLDATRRAHSRPVDCARYIA